MHRQPFPGYAPGAGPQALQGRSLGRLLDMWAADAGRLLHEDRKAQNATGISNIAAKASRVFFSPLWNAQQAELEAWLAANSMAKRMKVRP